VGLQELKVDRQKYRNLADFYTDFKENLMPVLAADDHQKALGILQEIEEVMPFMNLKFGEEKVMTWIVAPEELKFKEKIDNLNCIFLTYSMNCIVTSKILYKLIIRFVQIVTDRYLGDNIQMYNIPHDVNYFFFNE
jgi:hypothetical protein